MIEKIVVRLNSGRPTMNRALLTDAQDEQRLKDIGGKALASAGIGALGRAVTSAAKTKIDGGQVALGSTAKEASLGGLVSGVIAGGREVAKDALHTFATHDVSENRGRYAPDPSDHRVQEELRTIARRERHDATPSSDGKMTTPSLQQLGMSCDQHDLDNDIYD